MISISEGVRIEQPMAKWAFWFVALVLLGVIPPGAVLPLALIIVGFDLALPWKVTRR